MPSTVISTWAKGRYFNTDITIAIPWEDSYDALIKIDSYNMMNYALHAMCIIRYGHNLFIL